MPVFSPHHGPTANELVRDAFVRRKIYLLRYARGLGASLIAVVDGTEHALQDEIKKRMDDIVGRDLGKSTNSRLTVLTNALTKIRGPAFATIRDKLDSDMRGVADSEVKFIALTLHQSSPVKLKPKMPDEAKLFSIVDHQPVQGHMLASWMDKIQADDMRRIVGVIYAGIAQGHTLDQSMREIFGTGVLSGGDGVVESTRRDIMTIVRTTIATVTGEARQQFAKANKS